MSTEKEVKKKALKHLEELALKIRFSFFSFSSQEFSLQGTLFQL